MKLGESKETHCISVVYMSYIELFISTCCCMQAGYASQVDILVYIAYKNSYTRLKIGKQRSYIRAPNICTYSVFLWIPPVSLCYPEKTKATKVKLL